MALIDIFKKKKKEKEKIEVKEQPEDLRFQPPTQPLKDKEMKMSETYWILKVPLVTEKATNLAKRNQYVFKVFPKANKSEIKKSIENLYGVDVLDVRIGKVPRKRRRLGRIRGWRKGYKKAIVRIKEGQKIEIMPR